MSPLQEPYVERVVGTRRKLLYFSTQFFCKPTAVIKNTVYPLNNNKIHKTVRSHFISIKSAQRRISESQKWVWT
jgi:hypothetical protein